MLFDWLIIGAGYSACVMAERIASQLYPILNEENRDRLNLYLKEVEKLNGTVLFAGRLGDYKYYDMDQAVVRTLGLFEKEIANSM